MNKYIIMLDKTPEPWEDYGVPITVVKSSDDEITEVVESFKKNKPEDWYYYSIMIFENYEHDD